MALKLSIARDLRFDSAPIPAYRLTISYILALCYIVVIFFPAFNSAHFFHSGLLLVVGFSAFFAVVIFYTKRITIKRYLLLNDEELKQVEVKKHFVILWNDAALAQINKNKQGETKSLSILTNSGKLWNLTHYTDMGRISEYVKSRVKTGQVKGLINSLRTKPAASGILINALSIAIIFGWRIFPEYVPIELVIVPIIFLGFWLYPTKLGSYQSKRLLRHTLYGYALLAAVVILILILLMVFGR